MSIDELCALPVKRLAEKDCLLFLWATFPQLPEALQLIKAWGFTFKTVAFVWLKRNKKSPTWFYGLGYWTRGNAEICLLAKRGKPKRHSAGVHQFIISPVEEHSKKPDVTRDKIVELAGDLSRTDETTTDLFWRCASCWRPAFFIDPGARPYQRRRADYGIRHAPWLPAGPVRTPRPAP